MYILSHTLYTIYVMYVAGQHSKANLQFILYWQMFVLQYSLQYVKVLH